MGTTPPKINAKNKFWHKPYGYDGETLTGKTSMGGLNYHKLKESLCRMKVIVIQIYMILVLLPTVEFTNIT